MLLQPSFILVGVQQDVRVSTVEFSWEALEQEMSSHYKKYDSYEQLRVLTPAGLIHQYFFEIIDDPHN